MKSSRSRIALLAFLCGTSLLQADILILKNGNKVEGNILGETAESIRMRYRLTPKIWDEKDFPRTDIQEVIKQSPQEVELIELKKLFPTPDLLTADKYEQLIQDRLLPFVNKYPGTPEATEAEGLTTTLQEEKKRVSNGELKLAGRWLSASEAKGEQYNIDAFKLLTQMKEHMAKNNWLEALQVFDGFAKAKPSLIASTHYPTAVAEALVCMDKLDAIYSKMSQDQPALSRQRDDGLKKLNDDDRARTKAAIADESNKWRAQSEAQRRVGIRWSEPYKYDMPSISLAQKHLVSERTRIESLNLEDMKVRNEAFVAVYRKIGEGDYAGGATAYERIQGFSSMNDYRDIVNDLKSKLLKLHGDLVRKSQGAQSAVSGSSAIGGAATSTVDDRVARILAENNGTAGQPAAAGQPGAVAQAPVAVGAPGAMAPGTAPAAVAAPAVAQAPVQAPAPNPPVQQQPGQMAPQPQMPAPAAYVPAAEESNLQTYIIIGMGVLLVLFGLMAFKKKQQPAE